MSNQPIVDQHAAPQANVDWGEAPDVKVFYGRKSELTRLEQWIASDRYRLITILGLGGIGKTSLVTRLAEKLKNDFEYVIWRSLRNTPPVGDVLEDCIEFISGQHAHEQPQRVDNLIDVLISYLQQHRCLLVLDNAEALLRKGDRAYDQAYEGYGKLFQKLGSVSHQSCLVLTSREEPREFATLAEIEPAPLVRSLALSGLGQEEGRKILQDKGLFGSEAVLEKLIDHYSGNPMALKMVAEPIRELYAGDVASFLTDAESLSRDVRALLSQQFDRLADLEKDAMYWLAIMREAISLNVLQKYMSVGPELAEALDSLKRRAFIEESGVGFTLQDVVMEYMTDLLIEQIYSEIENQSLRLLKSHALVVAQAQEYVRAAQIRLILIPIAERLQATWRNKTALDRVLTQLLSILGKQPKSEQCYGGGNVLDLLSYLNAGYVHGYDFSGLAVWQADLRDVRLHDVNFSGADLSTCVFKDTFGIIPSVAFSPDGKLLAAGTTDGEVRLWEVPDFKLRITCAGHTDWVRSVAFSPDGMLLASSSEDKTVRLWEVSSGACIKVLDDHTSRVMAVAFSPDGAILASGSDDRTIRLWDVGSKSCIKVLEGHTHRVMAVAFHPDGQKLASSGEDQTVRLWDISTGLCLASMSGHTSRVVTVAFSPDGRTLASGGEDQIMHLWDVGSQRVFMSLFGHTNSVWSVAFSPDGRTLASAGEDQSVRLWDVGNWHCLTTLQGYTNPIWSVAFSSEGRTMASGSEDQIVRLWDVNSTKPICALHGHTHRVRSVAVSPDNDMVASGGEDQTVRLWKISSQSCVGVLNGHDNRVRSVAFSPDGRLLASGSEDQTVRLWDVNNKSCVRILQEHSNPVWSVAFSPDGKTLASGSDDQTIRLWDMSGEHPTRVLDGHTNRIWSIAFSPDGQLLASGSDDQTIRLWDVNKGQCLNILQGDVNRVLSVIFSQDGRTLASGSDDQVVRLWDVGTGQCLDILKQHTNWVMSVAFSPSDPILASGSKDGTIRLWDVTTRRFLKTLKSDMPYEGMNITGAEGLTQAQKDTLKALGAIEH